MNLNKMKTNNMKTTKIINENQENILEDFKKIIKFSKDPTYNEKQGGWIFDGDITFIDKVARGYHIPHPIAEVNGNVVMGSVAVDFNSLKNFPKRVNGNVSLMMAPGLVDLTTDDKILVTGEFLLRSIPMKSLSGFNVNCSKLILTRHDELESIIDFPGHAELLTLDLTQCPKISNDLTKTPPELANRVEIKLVKTLKVVPQTKIMKAILFDLSKSNGVYAPVTIDNIDKLPKEIKDIISKYQGAGAKGMFALIRELMLNDQIFINLF